MPLRLQWTPDQFAGVLAKIRDAMNLSAADLARLAGISRSQASRWGRGAHQPAYPNVRQLGIAVYRDHPELAQELMASAGYPAVTDDDVPTRAPAALQPTDEWERSILDDRYLPEEQKRFLIERSRDARLASVAARRAARERAAGQAEDRSGRGTSAG